MEKYDNKIAKTKSFLNTMHKNGAKMLIIYIDLFLLRGTISNVYPNGTSSLNRLSTRGE